MSCMFLSDVQIATVAHGLAFLLNGSAGMCSLAAAPELFDALDDCRTSPRDCYFDDAKIFRKLFELNAAAYAGRYSDGAGPEIPPEMPDRFPHLMQRLNYEGGRYITGQNYFSFVKALDSFIYQCSEDANRGTPPLDALKKTAVRLYTFAVENSAEYKAADWVF